MERDPSADPPRDQPAEPPIGPSPAPPVQPEARPHDGGASPMRAPSLVERWEALEGGVQSAIAYPIAAVVLFLGHAAFFPRTRWVLAITYGLFWAIPATAAIVAATAHERRKRAAQRDP
jgi:hypothetical protein